MKLLHVAPLVLAIAVPACAPKAPPPPDENAIRAGISAQMAKIGPAVNAKDTAALGRLFVPDAVWILPDASTFTGRASITAGGHAFFATFDSATMSTPTIDKLVVVNDSEAVTFAHGTYSMVVKGKNSGPRVNPFADLWRKGADGSWRIAYEINADGAAPAAAAGH